MSDKPINKPRSNLVSTLLGVGLILLGILFLFGRLASDLFNFDIGHYAWPFFIIIPGILMFMASFLFERKAGVTMAIFGGVLTTIGVILFVQNTFDIYATWSYAWALIAPTSIGLSKMVYGSLRGLEDEVKSGLNLTRIGLGIFVIAAFFFELVIGVSGFRFAWYFWPGLLIGLGIVLLLNSLFQKKNS
jgi:hypothetical protein